MSDKKRLIKNTASLFVLQAANYILPFVSLPYLIRVLGPEKFGLIAFATTFLQLFVIFTDYGFNFSATRQIAINRHNVEEVSRIFSIVMLIKTALMVISFFLMTIIVFSIPQFFTDWPIYFIMFLTVLGNVMFPIWFFQGMEKMGYITVLTIIAKTITTVGIFLFVKSQADYYIAAFIQSLSFVISGLISILIVWRYFPVKLLLPNNWKEEDIINQMKDSSKVFTSALAGNVYIHGSVLITGLLAGHVAAGYYSIGQKIMAGMVGLVQPVAQAIYPYLSQHVTSNRNEKIVVIRDKVILTTASLGLLVGSVLFINAEFVDRLLTGGANKDLVTLIKIFAFIIFFDQLNVVINSFIMAFGQFSAIQRMYINASIFFLIISIPATYYFGTIGMACTMLFVVELYVLTNSVQILFISTKTSAKEHLDHESILRDMR